MSDELEPIGISLVLDDGLAEGLRRISQDMSLFSRQADQTAAQMSRIARLHLGAFIPPEPVRPQPPAAAAVVVPEPPKSPVMPAITAPQAPRPAMLAPAPAPTVPVKISGQQRPFSAAIASMPGPPPARTSTSVPQPAVRPAPAVQQPAPPPAVSVGQQVSPRSSLAPSVQQAPPAPSVATSVRQAPPPPSVAPSVQQVPPQPRPMAVGQEVAPQTHSMPAVRQVPPPPRTPPVAISSPPPGIAAAVPPPAMTVAPLSVRPDKPAARPTIQVALSNPSSPVPPPGRPVPVHAVAAAEIAPSRIVLVASPSSAPPPAGVSSSDRTMAALVPLPRQTARTTNAAPLPVANTAAQVVVGQRPPKVNLAPPSAIPGRTATQSLTAVALPLPSAATVVSNAPVLERVTPPPKLPTAPSGGRNFVSRVPSSAPPVRARQNAQATPTSATAETTQAPAAPGQAQMATVQGDVMLDGAQVGRWISSAMAREAARPPTAARGFNTRMAPAWPGTSL